MTILLQNQISKLFELNDKKDALINVLFEYCERVKDAPTSTNLFDIIIILEHLKKYSKELRENIEQIDDIL